MPDAFAVEGEPTLCPECDTDIAPRLLACPGCGRLVHGDELRRLAEDAQTAATEGRIADAVACWDRMLSLLPPESRQWSVVYAKYTAARAQLAPADASGTASADGRPATPSSRRRIGGLAGIGVLVVALLSKGKLLALGFTKLSTILTMLLSMGVYWTEYGYKFAVGLVLSIYVHEMGHVAALRHYGIKASAPMFIPGIGAIVRLRESLRSPIEDSRVGLAGPVWGLAAALATYGVYQYTKWPSWAAIAVVGAWINLFNLLPVWQLDGNRGFNGLSRAERWAAVAAIAVMWWLTQEGLLVLILLFAVIRAFGTAPDRRDPRGLVTYILLVVVSSLMCLGRPIINQS